MDFFQSVNAKDVLFAVFILGGYIASIRRTAKDVSNLNKDNRETRDRLTRLETSVMGFDKSFESVTTELNRLRIEVHETFSKSLDTFARALKGHRDE